MAGARSSLQIEKSSSEGQRSLARSHPCLVAHAECGCQPRLGKHGLHTRHVNSVVGGYLDAALDDRKLDVVELATVQDVIGVSANHRIDVAGVEAVPPEPRLASEVRACDQVPVGSRERPLTARRNIG